MLKETKDENEIAKLLEEKQAHSTKAQQQGKPEQTTLYPDNSTAGQVLNTHNIFKRRKVNSIAAFIFISESEFYKIPTEYNKQCSYRKLLKLLHNMGADITRPIEEQYCVHRNRFRDAVLCKRWVCHERIDDAWLKSGNASKAAIDKVEGGRMLEGIYRMKQETEYIVYELDRRDEQSEGFDNIIEQVRLEFEQQDKLQAMMIEAEQDLFVLEDSDKQEEDFREYCDFLVEVHKPNNKHDKDAFTLW